MIGRRGAPPRRESASLWSTCPTPRRHDRQLFAGLPGPLVRAQFAPSPLPSMPGLRAAVAGALGWLRGDGVEPRCAGWFRIPTTTCAAARLRPAALQDLIMAV